MYRYRAKFERAIDGDTLVLLVDLGLNVWKREVLRLSGVNAPELNSPDPALREKAIQAKEYVERELTEARIIQVETFKPYPTDKYGRWVASVSYGGALDVLGDLSANLIAEGLAEAYP